MLNPRTATEHIRPRLTVSTGTEIGFRFKARPRLTLLPVKLSPVGHAVTSLWLSQATRSHHVWEPLRRALRISFKNISGKEPFSQASVCSFSFADSFVLMGAVLWICVNTRGAILLTLETAFCRFLTFSPAVLRKWLNCRPLSGEAHTIRVFIFNSRAFVGLWIF